MTDTGAHEDRRIGLVEVYTGDGKGKTTAALGLAMRAAGHGMRTYIGQFLKGWLTGELEAARMMSPYIVIEPLGEASSGPVPMDTRQADLAHRGLRRVREVMAGGEYDIVVLEEINVALSMGLVSLDEVLALITERPPEVELVFTGRGAPRELILRADLVTEMAAVKHPYQQGIGARPGIEF
jgi:cob(I)alamin adenosyltransferase